MPASMSYYKLQIWQIMCCIIALLSLSRNHEVPLSHGEGFANRKTLFYAKTMGKPLFDFEVHVNAHNRGKCSYLKKASNECIGKSNYVLTRTLVGESCVITLLQSHQTLRVENCVNLLKSTVELYLFSVHIINVIPSQSFPHSMLGGTHARQMMRSLNVGIKRVDK